MPHQCVRCGNFFDDGANEILNGCSCGGKFFFYIKKSKLAQIQKTMDEAKLTDKDRRQIEKDITEMIGTRLDEDAPVVLDIESVNIVSPGKYIIDIVHLFKKEPVVFKIEEGKYIIDLAHSFQKG